MPWISKVELEQLRARPRVEYRSQLTHVHARTVERLVRVVGLDYDPSEIDIYLSDKGRSVLVAEMVERDLDIIERSDSAEEARNRLTPTVEAKKTRTKESK